MWKEIDKNSKMLVSSFHEFPKYLYRYRTINSVNLDRLIEFEIIEEAIYLAGLKELNDPDEGRFLIKIEGTYTEILEFWKKALKSSSHLLTVKEIKLEAKRLTKQIIDSNYSVPEQVISYTRYVFEHVLRIACFTRLS